MKILKKGSKGESVKELQLLLSLEQDGIFGKQTEGAVKKWQQENGLEPDGIIGNKSWAKLKQDKISGDTDTLEKYKNRIIQGSTFPDAEYSSAVKITLNNEMKNEYLPELERLFPIGSKGLKLLLTIMAYKEGFIKGSRSYRNNNPGNIGNTDSGTNKKLSLLAEGILLQQKYIDAIIANKKKAYPYQKEVVIKPYYSKEIAKNTTTYKMSPWLPGYRFIFTGQLDQFVKIYSTGARGGNSYINLILSYFKLNGIDITPETTLQEIVSID